MRAKAKTRHDHNSGLTELFLQPFPVHVIAYDVLAAIAAGHQVVDRAGLET